MSDFVFDSSSLSDSKSVADAVHKNYYPNNTLIVKQTSLYESGGFQDRQLTSYDAQEILQGRGLVKNEKMFLAAATNGLDVSIGQALTATGVAGYQSGDSFELENPENQGSSNPDKNKKARITGAAAVNYTVAESLISKNLFGANTTNDIISTLSEVYGIAKSAPETDITEPTDVAVPSAGRMDVAISSDLTEEERQYYTERGTFLKNMTVPIETHSAANVVNDHSYLNGTGAFDIADNMTDIKETGSYYPGVNEDGIVSADLIARPSVSIFPSAALMELIIRLNSSESSIKVKGGLGIHRAGNPSIQGPNLTPLEPGDTISDHVFGRGFDINYIGLKTDSVLSNVEALASNPEEYKKLLELLLEELNTIAATQLYLIPDLIVFHSALGSGYGVKRGLEGPDSEIGKKYPNLQYVNFSSDSNHDDHIHMSFSGARAGKYVGPGGLLLQPTAVLPGGSGEGSISSSYSTSLSNSISSSLASSGITGVEQSLLIYQKLTKPAGSESDPNASVTDLEFFIGMSQYWGIEACALLWAIAYRESRHKCYNLNAGWDGGHTRYSGDYSIGIFQLNCLINAHGNKTVIVPFTVTGRDTTQPVELWKLAFTPWATSVGLDGNPLSVSNFNNFIKEYSKDKLMETSMLDVSKDMLIPANQFHLSVILSGIDMPPPGSPKVSSDINGVQAYRFGAWGDYKGGKGFISDVPHQLVVDFYVKFSGKTAKDFDDWFRLMMYDNSTWTRYRSPAYKYIEEWISGADQSLWTGNVTPIVPPLRSGSGDSGALPGSPSNGETEDNTNELTDYAMPNEIVLIGDSISHSVATDLVTAFSDKGFKDPLVLTQPGRTVWTPQPILGTFTSTGGEVLQELKDFYNYIYKGNPKAKRWVIELIGNNVLFNQPENDIINDLKYFFNSLKDFLTEDAIVYWVLIATKAPRTDAAPKLRNLKPKILSLMKSELPNSTNQNRVILDWGQVELYNLNYITDDGVHLSDSGMPAYVQFLKNSIPTT